MITNRQKPVFASDNIPRRKPRVAMYTSTTNTNNNNCKLRLDYHHVVVGKDLNLYEQYQLRRRMFPFQMVYGGYSNCYQNVPLNMLLNGQGSINNNTEGQIESTSWQQKEIKTKPRILNKISKLKREPITQELKLELVDKVNLSIQVNCMMQVSQLFYT